MAERKRGRKREREGEREIMVCMIIFVTAEGNQLSGWIWLGWIGLQNLRKRTVQSGVSVTWYVLPISWSPCLSTYHDVVEGTQQWSMAEFGSLPYGDFTFHLWPIRQCTVWSSRNKWSVQFKIFWCILIKSDFRKTCYWAFNSIEMFMLKLFKNV